MDLFTWLRTKEGEWCWNCSKQSRTRWPWTPCNQFKHMADMHIKVVGHDPTKIGISGLILSTHGSTLMVPNRRPLSPAQVEAAKLKLERQINEGSNLR